MGQQGNTKGATPLTSQSYSRFSLVHRFGNLMWKLNVILGREREGGCRWEDHVKYTTYVKNTASVRGAGYSNEQ